MNNISINLGNRLAKAGITTRKSSMRLAEETGNFLARKAKIGAKNINLQDVTEAVEKVIPERLRPEILTKQEEIIPYLIHTGYNEKQAKALVAEMSYEAMSIPNGYDVPPIYIPLGQMKDDNLVPIFAHELEHSLQQSNKLKQRFNKFSASITNFFIRIFGISEKYVKKYYDVAERLNHTSGRLQFFVELATNTSEHFNTEKGVFDCLPDKDSVLSHMGFTAETFKSKLRDILRNFVDCNAHGKYNNAFFKFLEKQIRNEVSAYTTGSNVHEKMLDNPNVTTPQTFRKIVYTELLDVIIEDKKTYRQNRIRRKLQPQHIFFVDNDLLKLAQSQKEKEDLSKVLPKISDEEKSSLYAYMLLKPDYFRAMLNSFTNPYYKSITEIKADDGTPVYGSKVLDILSQTSDEKLKEFSSIARERTTDGKYKYKHAAFAINHPRFDLIKELACIEVNGQNPYWDFADLTVLSAETVEKFYDKAMAAKAEGKEIRQELYKNMLAEISLVTKEEMLKRLLGV